MKSLHPGVLTELTPLECRQHLQSAERGRLGITFKALPVVIPVKIQMLGGDLSISSLLGDAIPLPADSVVALEVGTLGEPDAEEWSVEVRGILRSSGPKAMTGRVGGGRAQYSLTTEMIVGWALR